MMEIEYIFAYVMSKKTEDSMNTNRRNFYYWMQREVEQELRTVYKKIHRIEVFGGWFSVWFLNNEDAVSIPLSVMESIYSDGKSLEKLIAEIDKRYIARIKK